jgi:hypothetical protein
MIVLILIALASVLLSAVLKASTYLYRKSVLSWTHSFLLIVILLALGLVGGLAINYLAIPNVVRGIVGAISAGLIGVSFLKRTARSKEGLGFTWGNALLLCGVFLGCVVVLAVLLLVTGTLFLSVAQQSHAAIGSR